MPNDYIIFLEYSSISDLIENLYLKSMIDAYPKVLNVPNIHQYNENNIRDEFLNIICFGNGKLSKWINNSSITLTVENQIITKEKEKKRTDIAFIIPKLKYVVECKKLKGVSKQQYIDNGISRFINHKYIGENEKNAGICSFVVNTNIEKVIVGIKDRIKQYQFLQIINNKICNFDFSFSSTHLKTNNRKILLHHLFFDMNIKDKCALTGVSRFS